MVDLNTDAAVVKYWNRDMSESRSASTVRTFVHCGKHDDETFWLMAFLFFFLCLLKLAD